MMQIVSQKAFLTLQLEQKMSKNDNHLDQYKEVLEENLRIVEYCIETQKNTNKDGIYGYPAAILLLSLISSVGSIYEGIEVTVITDKTPKLKKIRGTDKHIYILNSSYFDQKLSEKELNFIYINIRNHLIHNMLTPAGNFLISEEDQHPFSFMRNSKGNPNGVTINIKTLHALTKDAITSILQDKGFNKIFNSSRSLADVKKKSTDFYHPSIESGTTLTKAASGVAHDDAD
jgi:hypothetical protein